MASRFHTLSSQSLFQNADGEVTWIEDMRESLEELVLLLRDEHTVSSYELQSSGLVQTLLNILNNVSGLKDILYNVQVSYSKTFNEFFCLSKQIYQILTVNF